MQIAGLVAVGLMWLRMAAAAAEGLAAGSGEARFYEAKLTTARFFAERFLPDAGALRRKIEAGEESPAEETSPVDEKPASETTGAKEGERPTEIPVRVEPDTEPASSRQE